MRHPAIVDEHRVASPGDLIQQLLGLILATSGVCLLHIIQKLSDLILDFGCGDLGEELPSLDVIADIDKAPHHIAAGAPVDACFLEAERRRRQCHVQWAETLRNRINVHARDEIRLLFGGVHDLEVLLVMPPHAQRERAREQQEHAEAKQPAAGSAPPRGPVWPRFAGIGIRRWKLRRRRRPFQLWLLSEVVHSGTSSKTPWAGLPSLPLRSIANRYGTTSRVV